MNEEIEVLARLKGKNKGGKLDGWYIEEYKSKSGPTLRKAFGYIHGDRRWRDGQNIGTSLVVEVHEDLKIIETANTYYEYGEPATEEQIRHLKSFWY